MGIGALWAICAGAAADEQAQTRSLWPEDAYVGLGLPLVPGTPRQVEDDWQIVPRLAIEGQYYRNSPYKTYAEGLGADVAVNYRRSYYAALSYHFITTEGNATYPGYAQHEIYAVASYSRPLLAAALSYAYLYETTGAIGASNHVGLSGRFSPLGDIYLNTAVSVYTYPGPSTVLRGELAWRIPLGPIFSIQPGVAAYWTNVTGAGSGQFAGPVSGQLTLYASTARGSIWAGGKLGDEYRSAYMDLPAFYDLTEHVSGGAWLGGRLRLERRWALTAHAAWDRYYQPVLQTQSDGFYLTLSVSRIF